MNGHKPNNRGPTYDKVAHSNEKVAHHNDKTNKNKGKKIDRHCNFCDRDGHINSKCFKKMEALEEEIKKHNIHLDTSSASYSGQTLFAYAYASSSLGYALNVSSSSSSSSSFSHEWLIDSGASYHMGKDKYVF